MLPIEIEPLRFPALESAPEAGWIEKGLRNMILLCAIAQDLARTRYANVEKACKENVAARPEIPLSRWGDTEERQTIARIVCEECAEGMGWPNSNFVPEDSFQIVFYFGIYDCFDGMDTMRKIWERLDVLEDLDEVERFVENDDATMLDLVIFCEQQKGAWLKIVESRKK